MARMTPHTLERIRTAAEGLAAPLGLSIEGVDYVREAGNWYLRVTVNRPGGVSSDDCASLSRPLSKRLDEMDPISDNYFLEVQSPGVVEDGEEEADARPGGGTA